MAKALVMAVNKTHADPVKDVRGCHKRGDIIVVKPNAHVWSAAEQNPDVFAIVDVPDSWLTDANDYTGILVESASEIVPFSARQKPSQARLISRAKERKPLRRHRYSIDLDGGGQLIDRRNP